MHEVKQNLIAPELFCVKQMLVISRFDVTFMLPPGGAVCSSELCRGERGNVQRLHGYSVGILHSLGSTSQVRRGQIWIFLIESNRSLIFQIRIEYRIPNAQQELNIPMTPILYPEDGVTS